MGQNGHIEQIEEIEEVEEIEEIEDIVQTEHIEPHIEQTGQV